ncbi:MAG: DUF5989 family protein [Deltaproteobacteria bacterium]|nr:DUF5989 family protein [Deltaproteobacteria bacterium]
MSKLSIAREFGEFLLKRRKIWLIPICILLLIFGAVIIFAEGSAIAPFIYALF